MDQDEGEGISEIPNPNPLQDGEVGALEVVGSRFLDSPSLMDPVYGGEDGARGSEGEEVVGGDAAEKVEPSVGDALEDGKSLVDVWEEEMGPLVDVVAEKEVRPSQVESGCAAVVEEVGSSVRALDAAEETEPLLGDSTEVAVEPIENALEKGVMEPLEDALVEERMEPLLDAVGEDKGEPLVDSGMEDEVEPLVGAVVEESESLAGAVEDDEDVQPLVNTTAEKVVEPLVNALVEEDEPLVNDVVVEGTEVLAEATKHTVDTMEEEAAEPLLNAVEEEAAEPLLNAVAEEEAEPLLDALEGGAAEPLLDAVEDEVTAPLLDAVEEEVANPLLDVEEKAVEPLVGSKVEEPAENLMDSRAEEATEHLRDSVAEEAGEPLMDSRLEEAATTLDHSMVEEDAEPLADDMVEEDLEPLADNMVEEDAEPLADNMVEEDAEPLTDNMVEEDAEPLADNMVEEDAEPLADNMVGEDVEPLADNMVEEDVDTSTVSAKKSVGKRKRGRPPKTQQTRTLSKRKMEEDVCFICFDGGNLVVCDRRGCPKVYHPACVNRDDAFFRSKGRWNCGWHICSSCEKTANYMCYTCTYSLCKGCIKESAFVCIRGNKGLCQTCMSTVMLIETNQHSNKTMSGVDFDDKTSWEYLFKDYWLDLRGKLSLTLEELTGAKTPRKESNVTVGNDESSEELYDANVDQVGSSDNSSERRGISNPSRKKLKKGSRVILKEEGPTRALREDSHPDEIDWASNELLEFVAHMKGGDRSLLSQFDVQALLLEYIKHNNLRDPRRKSQIICDARLQSLFGKPRVGHFEMLKLLESHFLMKEVAQPVTDESQGGVVDPDSSPVDADGNSDASTRLSFDKRRKTRKRTDEKEPQTNLDDYAAIDVHNINLMYLRRNLMEDLIDDTEFSEKVIGCFVRIRISGASQKQDMYRLVQVVGTRMALEKYKTGKKMTDIMLEILNLDKTEVVTVDVISNQDFTEEECKRLRQSIKCGLISRLTVGDIQEKARALQAVRVNDWLENEKSRLGHLRDRASEKGRRKELRECVEKLQLLNTPEERMKRLNDVPEIHSDPHMDPDYESAEEEPDDKKRDNYRSRESSSLRKAREAGFLGKGGSSSSTWNERKSSETNSEVGSRDRVDSQRKDVSQLNVQSTAINLETGSRNNNQLGKKPGQSSDIPSDTVLGSLSSGVTPQPIVNETEKIWHYKDPSGKIQGPFSMAQLRKWSTTGYFPQNLRIWRISDKQDNSILLTDAMNGKFLKDLSSHDPQHSSFSQSARVTSATENRGATGNFERTIADKWPSQPPMWSAPIREAANPTDLRNATSSRGWEPSMNASALSRQVQGHDSPRSSALSGNSYRSPSSHQEMGHRNTWTSNRPRGQTSDQSTGEQKAQAVYDISKQWGSDPSNLPTPAPQATSIMWTASQAALSNSVASVQHMNASWGTTPGGIGTHLSSSTSQDHTDTLRTNSVAGWGLSSLSNVPKETEVGQVSVSPPITSLSMPTTGKIVEPFGSTQTVFGDLQVSHRQVSPLDAAGVLRNQLISEPPPADKMSPVKNPIVFSGPSAREISGRNQFFESDCPSPTPKSEQAADDILSSEYNQQTAQLSGRQIILQDGGRSDPTSDSVYGIFSDGGNLPSRPDTSAENLPEKSHIGSIHSMGMFPSQPMVSAKLENPVLEKEGTNAAITSMRIQSSLTPDVAQNVQHHAAVDARIKAETNVLDSASSQRSEGSAGTQIRPGSHGWAPIPSAKQERQEPSLSGPERGSEWSMPSPTPTTTPSGWGSGINSATRGNQNSQFATTDGSKMPATSQKTPNSSNETAQPSVKDVQNPGWVVPTPNSNVSMGQAQGSGNIGTVIPGNLNPGWGMVPQSNVNVAWGIPAQSNSNMNVSWATPTQGNTSTNTGWSTSTPGNTNANLPWGALAQGNMIANAGLGALTQGVTTMMPTQGYPNPQPGWGAPTPGNTNQNPSWGTAGQGNTNANASSVTSQAWDPSSGSSNNWNTQQKQSGDGHSGQGDRGFQSNDAGHNTGRQSWNRSHSGGGGSRPPARGQRAGICRFHENGHCKKGANCNYFHS